MKLILTLSIFLSALSAFAGKKDNYVLLCGSQQEVRSYYHFQGYSTLTDKEMKKIQKQRLNFLTILEKGSVGIQEVSDREEAYEAQFQCGLIDELKEEIRRFGCHNLETNQKITHGGIQACAKHFK